MYLLDPLSLITRTLVISFYPPTIYVFNQSLPQVQNFLSRNPFIMSTIPLPLLRGQSLRLLSLLRPCPRPRSGAEEVLVPLPLPSGDALFDLVALLPDPRRSVTDGIAPLFECVKECPVGAIAEGTPQSYRQQAASPVLIALNARPRLLLLSFPCSSSGAPDSVNLSRRGPILGPPCLRGFLRHSS